MLRGRVLVNKWAQVIVPDVAAGKSIVHVINKVCNIINMRAVMNMTASRATGL